MEEAPLSATGNGTGHAHIEKTLLICRENPAPDNQECLLLSSEIDGFAVFQLKLELIGDQGNKFGIGGFALGIADCVPEEAL